MPLDRTTIMDLHHWVLEPRTASPLLLSIASISLLVTLYFVICNLRSPLRQYPGPFLARYTNLWRLYYTTRGSFHMVLEGLHKTYGPVVRVGPNVLDVDYPEMNRTVFNTKGDWRKTEFILASSSVLNGKIMYNLFSQIDPEIHARWKKPVAKYYTTSQLAPMESHMDRTISFLCEQLEQRFMGKDAVPNQPIDLGEWILYYTWDVVGDLTFSQPLGYLASASDHDGTLRTSEKALDYFSLVSTMPWLDRLLDKNPVVRIGPPSFGPITAKAIGFITNRVQGLDKETHNPAKPDYLDRFLDAKRDFPDVVDDTILVSYLMINMMAGSDTTATTIRSVLYYALKTPGVWDKLREELARAGLTADQTPLSYKATRQIPYLEALIREALRIFPSIALSLERYVPAGGCTLPAGEFVPENAILAFNPYVLCRNKEVYGADADEFRPERWIRGEKETDAAFHARLQAMNDADLAFGGGSRKCLGQHMALMQVYKVVATLAVTYEIELVDPGREWKVVNSWFVRQEGFVVRMRKRVVG